MKLLNTAPPMAWSNGFGSAALAPSPPSSVSMPPMPSHEVAAPAASNLPSALTRP
jgi:hypothetical protein